MRHFVFKVGVGPVRPPPSPTPSYVVALVLRDVTPRMSPARSSRYSPVSSTHVQKGCSSLVR